MWKEKVLKARDYIVKNSKYAYPIVVIAVVAVTVVIALNAGNPHTQMPAEESSSSEESTQATEVAEAGVSLVINEDNAISTLIEDYYVAMATGDEEALRSICDEISDKDMLRYLETAKYTKEYSMLEIYTKPGLEEGTTIAYVYYKVVFESYEDEFPGYQAHYICTNDQGELYLKRSENSEEIIEYVKTVSAQDDVVEFNNRIQVEYNELMEQKPELLVYLKELDSQVSTAVGEGLAQLAAQQESEAQESTEEGDEGAESTEGSEVSDIEQYATATTTVNVRVSDSEEADKLGKLAEGTKVQVLEQRVNGWSKIIYETKEGYVKSEFLQLETTGESNGDETGESSDDTVSTGTVTATSNVNIRASASEGAEKIGTLPGGSTAELLGRENGWCKIRYDGKTGYVKEEFVQ